MRSEFECVAVTFLSDASKLQNTIPYRGFKRMNTYLGVLLSAHVPSKRSALAEQQLRLVPTGAKNLLVLQLLKLGRESVD